MNSRARTIASCVLLILSCQAAPPPWADSGAHGVGSEGIAEPADAWPELDPPDSGGDDDTAPSPGGAGDEGGSEPQGDPPDVPEPSPDALDKPLSLKISAVAFDPSGSDGAAESPEWLRLQNTGSEAAPLWALRVQSRQWPAVDADRLAEALEALAETLGVASEELALPPGASLTLLRVVDLAAAGLPQASVVGADWQLVFEHGSGLRNDDGAALVEDGLGAVSDALQWGNAPSEAPFVGPAIWAGEPAISESGALCRSALDSVPVDSDTAQDWQSCEAGL